MSASAEVPVRWKALPGIVDGLLDNIGGGIGSLEGVVNAQGLILGAEISGLVLASALSN